MERQEYYFDFSNYCRICAENQIGVHHLFDAKYKGIALSEIISFCTQLVVQQSDNRPSSICTKCFEKLEIAYEFQSLARISEEKFQHMLLTLPIQPSLLQPMTLSENRDTEQMKSETEGATFSAGIDESVKFEVQDYGEGDFDFMMDANDDSDYEPPTSSWKQTKPKKQRKKPATLPNKSTEKRRPGRPKTKSKNDEKSLKAKEIKIWRCHKCDITLPSLKHTQLHLKDHNDATPHECSVCGLYFSMQNFNRHLCKGEIILCEYCPQVFDSTAALLEHAKSHENQLIMNKCLECPKYFAYKTVLDWHAEVHKNMLNTFFCHICNRGFPMLISLRVHIKTHSKAKPHLCSDCGKGFAYITNLRDHLKIHANIKEFQCPQCPQQCRTKRAMLLHMDVHNDNKYECQVCHKIFSTLGALGSHKSKMHGNRKTATCEICQTVLFSNYHLKRHMLTHTGERPYKCDYCDKTYRQKPVLNDHLKTHIGEKIYKCDKCDKGFKYIVELRKHSLEHYQSEKASDADVDVKINYEFSSSN